MKLSEKLKLLRELNNYSQQQLGDLINVTDKAISKWELGNGEPQLESLNALSKVFDVSLDYLLNDKVISAGDKKVIKLLKDIEDKANIDKLFKSIKKEAIEYFKSNNYTEYEDLLPTLVDGKIDLNIFEKRNGKLVPTYKKLLEIGAVSLIVKEYKNKINLDDAIEIGDYYLVVLAITNRLKDQNTKLTLHDLDVALENLPCYLKDYYKIIVALMDAGAAYYKQYSYGDDVTIHETVLDESKTNFIYRMSIDMTCATDDNFEFIEIKELEE